MRIKISRFTIVRLVLTLVVFVGAFVGIMPMLYTGILVGIISYFLNSYFPGKMLDYGSLKQLRDIAPSYGIALLLALSVYFLKYLPISNWVILPLQIVVGFLFLIFVCEYTNLSEYKEIKDIIKPFLSKVKLVR